MKATIETSKTWNGGPLTHDMFDELQGAMLASAKRIAADARGRINLGPGDPKHLRDTVRARAGRHEAAGGEHETALPVAYVFAGERRAGVYWHYMVEYGTYDKPAHPFMRPAVDANFNPTLAEAARAGKRALNKQRREKRQAN